MADFDLFDLSATRAAPLFERAARPWDVLTGLEAWILALGPTLGPAFDEVAPGVWVGRGTKLWPTAVLDGPAIVGPGGEVRPGAWVRAGVLAGEGCVLGNSCEFKNTVLFDGAQVPHFSYVGDSVLGRGVHFGAGAVASNFKAGGTEVFVAWEGRRTATGRTKLGVLAGDGADVGSQAVLNPGTVLGRGSVVYPLVSVRGTVPAATLVKAADREFWVAKT